MHGIVLTFHYSGTHFCPGLDAALAQLAEASKLALEEAAARAQTFSREGLTRARSDLESLEAMFLETMQASASGVKDVAQEILYDMVTPDSTARYLPGAARAVLKMLVEHGFFHADPHPGNVSYLPGNRIRGVALKELRLGAMLSDLVAILRQHQLALPPDLSLLVKDFISLECMGREPDFDFDFDMAGEAMPLLEQVLRARCAPMALLQRGAVAGGRSSPGYLPAAARRAARAAGNPHRCHALEACRQPARQRRQPAGDRHRHCGAHHRQYLALLSIWRSGGEE
jgi:hypothetical protein